jgi:mono/diheme cytochrome c family protein
MSRILAGLAVAAALSPVAATLAAPAPAPTISAWTRSNAMDTHTGTQIERGAAVFHNRCAACHGKPGVSRDGGSDMPGTTALEFKYRGQKPGMLEERTDLTPAIVKNYVRNGSNYMPQFRKTYVSDDELDALAAYLSRPRP